MKLFNKKAFRDFFERGFSVYVVAVCFFVFCQVLYILAARGTFVTGPDSVYPVGAFDQILPGVFFAVIAPFVIVYRKMGTHFSKKSGDLFWSLPVTRTGLWGSLVTVALAYLGIFLAAMTVTDAITFAVLKNITVEKHYFFAHIVLISVLYLYHLGIALICLSKSVGPIWYGIYSAGAVYLLLLVAEAWDMVYCSAGFYRTWDYPTFREFWDSGTGGRMFTGLVDFTQTVFYPGENLKEAWFIFTHIVAVPIVLGILLLALSLWTFSGIRTERVDGKGLSRTMHILFQSTLPWLTWFGMMGSEFWDMMRGFLILIPVCLVWEGFYQRSIRKIYRAWPGITIGIALSGILVLVANLSY